LPADCRAKDWIIPENAFKESSLSNHQGIFVALISIELVNNDSSISFHVNSHGGGRIAYAKGTHVNLITANNNQRDDNYYDVYFAQRCDDRSSGTDYLKWGDDDIGSRNAANTDWGTENNRMDVYFTGINSSHDVQYFKGYNATSPQNDNFRFSGSTENSWTGQIKFDLLKHGAYFARFWFVDDHNMISFEYPYDSGDFYLPCPDPSPPDVSGVCDYATGAITGIAYDKDLNGHELRIEARSGGTLVNTTKTAGGPNGDTGNFYYGLNVKGAMGGPPGTSYTFTITAKGIDGNGNPDGKDKTINVDCAPDCTLRGVPCAQGCPSMKEGIQSITVPMRDGIPETDPGIPSNGKVYQEDAGTVLFKREPVNPNTGANDGYWYHKMLPNGVYDQWGENDGGYLPYDSWTKDAFAIDYTPFMRKYPYDYHAISLMYSTAYKETMYAYTVPTGEYYCDSGWTYNNVENKCLSTYTANTTNPDVGPCPFGGTKTGSQCISRIAPKQYYTTPDSGQGRGKGVSAIKYMFWAYGQVPPPDPTHWTNAYNPVLDPCYNRTYEANDGATQISQPTFTDDNGIPTNENPTRANFNWTVGVTFGLVPTDPNYVAYDRVQSPQVRSPFHATMHYDATYYIKRNGALIPYGSSHGDPVMRVEGPTYSTGTVSSSFSGSAGVSVPSAQIAGDELCMSLDVYYRNGEMKNDGNDPVFGNRLITEQIDNTGGPHVTVAAANNCSTPVTNEPYAHFFGGDTQAGPGFSTGESCRVDSSAHISLLTRNTGTLPKGSGTQFAAQALSEISGFSSANLRKLFPTGSGGLSYSNTEKRGSSGTDSPQIGGWGGIASNYCIADYFGTMPKDTPSTSNNTAAIGVNGAQYYKNPAGGRITISGANLQVPNNVKQAIYIENGDLYIANNITFPGATAGWNSLSEIPSLYIIVKNGNIRIDPSVTRLDGIYVAQPNGSSKGLITTCGSASRSYMPSEIFNTCKNQLVVNGAFVARQIYLNRSFSSLRYAERYGGENGESPLYGSNHTCGLAGSDIPGSGPANSNDCAAEIFNFSPEFYLQQPAITNSGGPSSGKFDSYTGLSPVL
jgi:hypothetical protein